MPRIAVALVLVSFAALGGSARGQTAYITQVSEELVVPPVSGIGAGSGLYVFDEASKVLTYRQSADVLASTTVLGAELRLGEVGTNGPLMYLLAASGSNEFEGSVGPFSPSQEQALKSRRVYVNVLTDVHPTGGLRSQISPAGHEYVAFADGGEVVPPTSSSLGGTGSFAMGNSPGGWTLQYEFSLSTAAGPGYAVTIDDGPPGQNGPTRFTLDQTSADTWSGSIVPVTLAEVELFRGGRLHLSVKTPAFPGGEIRGELVPSFTRYGDGCNGFWWLSSLSVSGIPEPGGQVTLTLQNGHSTLNGLLFAGLDARLTPSSPRADCSWSRWRSWRSETPPGSTSTSK